MKSQKKPILIYRYVVPGPIEQLRGHQILYVLNDDGIVPGHRLSSSKIFETKEQLSREAESIRDKLGHKSIQIVSSEQFNNALHDSKDGAEFYTSLKELGESLEVPAPERESSSLLSRIFYRE